MAKPAVVLVSGGLDSATLLAMAKQQGYHCHALSFDYGQRHRVEVIAARRLVKSMQIPQHNIIHLDLTRIGGSALTDPRISVPERETEGIPVTYVPARNTIFLSFALAWAEVINACDMFIGVNAVDYSGYPDCRPEYIAAFSNMARLATKAGVEGADHTVHTPLIHLSKAEIIIKGHELNVDYSLTVSCYQADQEGRACGKCDSCRIRRQGFAGANVPDPTRYQ